MKHGQEVSACCAADALRAAAVTLAPQWGALREWSQCAAAAAAAAGPLGRRLADDVEFALSYCYDPSPYSCTGDFGAPPLLQCSDGPNYDEQTR
jgi:hypothetical protein